MKYPKASVLLFFLLLAVTTFSARTLTGAEPDVEKLSAAPAPAGGGSGYLPLVRTPNMVEMRALWVTRFDWTAFGQPADPTRIDEIVADASAAGFNAIFFQVRGTADAYYAPGLEPWAQRVSGNQLGDPPVPFWDPLAYFVNKAHAANIQLHAYINVYPVWSDCFNPPPVTTPLHFFHLLVAEHGTTGGKPNGLIWNTSGAVYCGAYQRATPASIFGDDHYIAIGRDLVARYAIDGIHLDHIRYGGSNTSCDPVSAARYGASCFSQSGYGDWQRAQVNGTVSRFYNEVVLEDTGRTLSAAVWPMYIDYWGWGASEGYYDYYQDSKAWLAGGYIDMISPMIYPPTFNCPDNSFWTFSRWQTIVADFQAGSTGRFVVPGIGASYCTFDEIANRIAAARSIGTAGHAIFSYSGLKSKQYFDDLAAGPYAVPAVPPEVTWHP